MNNWIPKLLLIFSISTIAFCYGFVARHYEIFPYASIRDAALAFKAVLELSDERPTEKNIDFWDESGIEGPTYRKVDDRAGREYLFFLGNERAYATAATGTAYLGWIADRSGRIIHAWRYPGEIWEPLTGRDAIGEKWRSYPVGAQVLEDGSLLVSYHGVGMFPSAMGLAKFDKDSKLLWKSEDYYHHWFSIGAEGEIYIPDLEFAVSPVELPDRDKTIICDRVRFPYDSIAVLDADGNKLNELDMFVAIVKSDLAGLISSNKERPGTVETCDPMHLNDSVVLTAELATEYPQFAAGDLLVSFRTLNAIAVLDPATNLIKWHFRGPSHHQHSPRFIGDGKIVFFDNLGGSVERGTSRVIVVDTADGTFDTLFPAEENDLPQLPFLSRTAGHIDVSPDRRRLLVASTHQGVVSEIDIETGDLLWEFINTHSVGERLGRISVYTAKYTEEPEFETNAGLVE